MPDFCTSGGCASTSDTTNTSLHLFPKSASQRRQWTAFVQTSRNDEEWEPAATSRLCSQHFTPDAFKNWDMFKMGYSKKLLIRPDAVPGLNISNISSAADRDHCLAPGLTNASIPDQLNDCNENVSFMLYLHN